MRKGRIGKIFGIALVPIASMLSIIKTDVR